MAERDVVGRNSINFVLFRRCGKVHVRRRPGEKFQRQCLKPSMKHAGRSIKVCGYLSGVLKNVKEKVDAEACCRILSTSPNDVHY